LKDHIDISVIIPVDKESGKPADSVIVVSSTMKEKGAANGM